jgi:hypothetical protein
MQKWYATEDSVRCNQAVIRGTWSDTHPSTSRIQVSCAARTLSCVWRDDHWQFAKHAIPMRESIKAIRSLQDLLQDRRRKPDRVSMFESFGEQLDFDQIVTA